MTGRARFFLYAGSLYSGWTDGGGSGNRVARYSRRQVVTPNQPLHLTGGAECPTKSQKPVGPTGGNIR